MAVPSWQLQAFKQFLDYSMQVSTLLRLSMRGISGLRGWPQLEKALADLDDKKVEPEQAEQTKKDAEFAHREVERGFPLLTAQSIVLLWAGLETAIKDFAVASLENDATARNIEDVRKVKISIADYDALPSNERYAYVLDQLEREKKSPLTKGVGRFERILEIFGLNGQVDPEVKRTLFEMNCVRNLFVHRRGIIDSKFIEACPSPNFKIGEEIRIDWKRFNEYAEAVSKYVAAVVNRVGERAKRKSSDPATGDGEGNRIKVNPSA